MNRIIPVLMVVFLLIGTGDAAAFTSITPSDAYDLLNPASASYNPNAFIIDVRYESEWLAGHAGKDSSNQGAFLEEPVREVFNIPSFAYNDLFDMAISQNFDLDDTIIVMCRSGNRSATASGHLEDSLGFINVFNLTGGFIQWQSAGLPYNNSTAGVWDPQSVVVPLPGSMLLMGAGIFRLLLVGKSRRR